jgi:hypothetical protein
MNQAIAVRIQETAQVRKKQTWKHLAQILANGSMDSPLAPKRPSKIHVSEATLKLFVFAISVALIATILLGIIQRSR